MATEAAGSPEPAPAPIPAPDPALAPAPSSSPKTAKSSRGGGKRRPEKGRSGEGGDAVNSAPPPPPLLPPPSSPTSGSPTAEGSKDVTPSPSPSKPGEKAQDNAVTARLMKTKMCYFYEQGKCVSDRCRYAHSVTELRDQPNLHKTKLCKAWAADGTCADGDACGFAHAEGELRVTDGIYKTQMCHFFERGRCLKGERCTHAHGSTDLRAPKTLPPSDDVSGAPGLVPPAVADRRAPMSPIALSELVADTNASRQHQHQQQQPSPVVAMAAASLAAAATAASNNANMNLFPPTDMGTLHYGVPPLPASPWSMPWSPSGPYGTPDAAFESMQPWASPGGVSLLEPYNPAQQWGCGGGLLDTYGWGADASLEHHRPDFNSAVVPCDLTARLASLDSAVAGLKNEVKNVTGGNATEAKLIHKI